MKLSTHRTEIDVTITTEDQQLTYIYIYIYKHWILVNTVGTLSEVPAAVFKLIFDQGCNKICSNQATSVMAETNSTQPRLMI